MNKTIVENCCHPDNRKDARGKSTERQFSKNPFSAIRETINGILSIVRMTGCERFSNRFLKKSFCFCFLVLLSLTSLVQPAQAFLNAPLQLTLPPPGAYTQEPEPAPPEQMYSPQQIPQQEIPIPQANVPIYYPQTPSPPIPTEQNSNELHPIRPYPLSVAYDKTTHLIFPTNVTYVDLGSDAIVAGKAEGVENIVRLKANKAGFAETTLSVVTSDGKFYSFLVNYNPLPSELSVLVRPPGEDSGGGANPGVTPTEIKLSIKQIAELAPQVANKRRDINYLGEDKNDMLFALHGIYVKQNTIFYKVYIKNRSNINFEIDFIKFFVRDKEVVRRSAIQESEVKPIYQYSTPENTNLIPGKKGQYRVYAVEKFTIPDNKILEIEMYEKGGGRNLKFRIANQDIVGAKLLK